MSPSYEIIRPAVQTSPVVVASPHSGRRYDPAFLQSSALSLAAIRSSEDAFVDQLVASVPDFGAPLLLAHVPRSYVDLNRAADEFDPALIHGAAAAHGNPRIASGLGVIPRVVSGGRAIYNGKLTMDMASARITDHWRPYHAALRALLDETLRKFGFVILMDMHSMPDRGGR
ncbi:MAG: N-formylglutamate amidohydrolase [Cypionkella sp.]|nr:N-formylglutamate amidohydrolase [Cypionkella sp.]